MAVACAAVGMKGRAVSGQAEARSEAEQQLLRCACAAARAPVATRTR